MRCVFFILLISTNVEAVTVTNSDELRAALAPGPSALQVTLQAGTYRVPSTIDTGERTVTLTGAGADRTLIEGEPFEVPEWGVFSVAGLTLHNALRSAGSLHVQESIVTGGIAASGSVVIERSAFVRSAPSHVTGSLNVWRTTFSESPLQLGSGAHTVAQCTLWKSPITTEPEAHVSVYANVIEAALACDHATRFISEGQNVLGDRSCRFADGWQGVTESLAPLASNGGATPTHVLLAASPGVDAFTCADADQRGFRPVGDCDAGAYERTPLALTLAVAVSGDTLNYVVDNLDALTATNVTIAVNLSTGETRTARAPTLLPGEKIQGSFSVPAVLMTVSVTSAEGNSARPFVIRFERSTHKSAEEETLEQDEQPPHEPQQQQVLEQDLPAPIQRSAPAQKNGCQQAPASQLLLVLAWRWRRAQKAGKRL